MQGARQRVRQGVSQLPPGALARLDDPGMQACDVHAAQHCMLQPGRSAAVPSLLGSEASQSLPVPSSQAGICSSSAHDATPPAASAAHLQPALVASKGSALPHPASHQLEGPCADLLPGSSHADDHGLAPAAVRALQCRPHHLHVADALEAAGGRARHRCQEWEVQRWCYLVWRYSQGAGATVVGQVRVARHAAQAAHFNS